VLLLLLVKCVRPTNAGACRLACVLINLHRLLLLQLMRLLLVLLRCCLLLHKQVCG
jgi:hypothetical protein